VIVVVGLSHKSAPIEVRERLAVSGEALPEWLAQLRGLPEVGEVMVLSTCNRVEIFATATQRDDRDGSRAADAIEQAMCARAGDGTAARVSEHLFRYTDDAAVRHVFRVACSLDSLVVGEPQILGQFKDAFEKASKAGTVGMLLGRAVDNALRVAKRVRSETQIGAGTVSISSAAIDMARQIFGDLSGRVVALLGAGEMAEGAAKVLCEDGASLRVVNRSLERAQNVALMFKGEARPWTELQRTLVESDVVIASTASPNFVLTRELVGSIVRARRGRSLFIIDIAVPRDVEPAVNELEGVYLYDIDDLEKIAAETMRGRLAEAQTAERIVDDEADAFGTWLESLKVTPAIVALRKHVQGVMEAELERSLGGKLKHLGAPERKALDAMVGAAVNKLMHTPSTRLKVAASEGVAGDFVDMLRHLFDLPEPEQATGAEGRDSSPPDGVAESVRRPSGGNGTHVQAPGRAGQEDQPPDAEQASPRDGQAAPSVPTQASEEAS
jgi:glutamyl-tRNA reductase